MFKKGKAYIISMPGTTGKMKEELEAFLKENNINAKVVPIPLEVAELE